MINKELVELIQKIRVNIQAQLKLEEIQVDISNSKLRNRNIEIQLSLLDEKAIKVWKDRCSLQDEGAELFRELRNLLGSMND